jgi:hypothetical protein
VEGARRLHFPRRFAPLPGFSPPHFSFQSRAVSLWILDKKSFPANTDFADHFNNLYFLSVFVVAQY